jgi:hypothetical protein
VLREHLTLDDARRVDVALLDPSPVIRGGPYRRPVDGRIAKRMRIRRSRGAPAFSSRTVRASAGMVPSRGPMVWICVVSCHTWRSSS